MCLRCVILVVLLSGIGCTSTTHVEITEPDKFASTANDRTIVLDCTVLRLTNRGDYSFAEEYLGPGVVHPANGLKSDLSLRVDSIVKGTFEPATLDLKNAKGAGDYKFPIEAEQSVTHLEGGSRIRLALNRGLFGRFTDYILVRRPPLDGT